MFSNKFIVIHFESMVVENAKAVGNRFMIESGVVKCDEDRKLDYIAWFTALDWERIVQFE